MTRRIVVIGGGIVGLCSAWSLQRRGWSVTVITEHATGFGASRINAGWIIPGLSEAVPSPGLVQQSVKWMRSSASPLYIQPRPSLELVRWLAEFWRHCNANAYVAGIEALSQLNRDTFALFDEMRADGITFEEHRDGILYVFPSRVDLEHEMTNFALFEKHGLKNSGPIVGDDLRQLEPALSHRINGAVLLEQERSIRPDSLTASLSRRLRELGVDLRANVKVEGLTITNDKVTDVVFENGRLETDAVLIAAGAWSPILARYADRRVPIQGGKGYALDYTPAPVELRHPIHVHGIRQVITPLDGMIRLAGTMELSGLNARIRPERVEAIVHGASQTLRGWPTDLALPRVGTGLRPMSADGLPIIGWLKGYQNLAIASGHGMLGLTLGPATGNAIADLMTEGRVPDELKPFDPARF